MTERGISESPIDVDLLLENLRGAAVFVAQPSPTRIEYANPAFEDLYGISRDAVSDDIVAVLDRIPDEDREYVTDIFESLDERPRRVEFQHRITIDDGPPKWLQMTITPIRDDGGATGLVVGVATDITPRKEREEELVLLHRLLRHDIRNDMAVIDGWLDVLAGRTEETQSIIERVRRASDQVIALTDATEEIVDITADEFDAPQLGAVAIDEVIELVVAEKRELYADAAFHIEGELPDVSVSANALLSTVFGNLIQNAVIHNDATTPAVTISATVDDETVRISISDNGPGIPEHEQSQLFSMGARGELSTGTGFGLYLCRQIVQKFGGRIWHDEAGSPGATFHVELPLSDTR